MITDTVLQAIPRDESGKNASRRLRADGRIPASVYGEGLDAVPVSVNARELGVILRSETGRHSIFTLAIDGKDSSPVKIHELDVDPVSNKLLHMDLMRISMTSKTGVSVPLEFVGEPVGVKVDGGMLDVHMHEIDVECLPRDIPTNIKVDVSEMKIGDRLSVSDLVVDEDAITIVTDGDHLVAAVIAARQMEEPSTVAPAPEAAAPAPAETPES